MSVINIPITGSVWKILVSIGDEVTIGQEVAIIESMKMEIPIESEMKGKVIAIMKNEGDFVDEGELFIKLNS